MYRVYVSNKECTTGYLRHWILLDHRIDHLCSMPSRLLLQLTIKSHCMYLRKLCLVRSRSLYSLPSRILLPHYNSLAHSLRWDHQSAVFISRVNFLLHLPCRTSVQLSFINTYKL